MKRLDDPSSLEEYSHDAGFITKKPAAVVVSESEQDAIACIERAVELGSPLVPRGAGTSIPSQAVGEGTVLLQSERSIVEDQWGILASPGVVKADLNRHLSSAGLWIPVDPSSFRSCTVGGMVANNSSGARTLKYGSTSAFVTSIRAVVPGIGLREISPSTIESALAGDSLTRQVAQLLLDSRADIEHERPRVTKNSCGYRLENVLAGETFNLHQLLIGSEGTLALTTRIRFRTIRPPKARVLLIAESTLEELGDRVGTLRRMSPSALELVDKSIFELSGRGERLRRYSRSDSKYLLFCELEGPGVAIDALGPDVQELEPLVVVSPGEIQEAWDVRNETLTVAGELRSGGRVLLPGLEDIVVPPERLGEMIGFITEQLEMRGLGYISYGHAGDANLHMRPFLDPGSVRDLKILHELMDECFAKVWKLKGSISGEHGDGRLRAEYVKTQYPKTHHVMMEIKRLFDPKGILNPGVKIV